MIIIIVVICGHPLRTSNMFEYNFPLLAKIHTDSVGENARAPFSTKVMLEL